VVVEVVEFVLVIAELVAVAIVVELEVGGLVE
jgi:hypothetical protein